MMMNRPFKLILGVLVGAAALTPSTAEASPPQLRRVSYTSVVDERERDCYLYLPAGYDPAGSRQWPVLAFLHGDGERGDGRADLDFILAYGPLYEAWIQKRDLPFIIVAPQLPMFGRDGPEGPDYIRNRTREGIPQRLEDGVPPRPADFPARPVVGPMRGAVAAEKPSDDPVVSRAGLSELGWRRTDPDLLRLLDAVLKEHRADPRRVYLSGASMGGFGTWYFASTYPERFAALLPVVGYPTVEQAEAIARAGLPAWVFSGGRDPAVPTEYFFAGMNRLDELGANFRFTTEQDMFHDVWNRVYAGEDVYQWLLQFRKAAPE